MKISKLFMASDHAGYELKLFLKDYLQKKGFQITDCGTDSADSCDYADYAHPLAVNVENTPDSYGITICGSGNGICMTANKHQKIRAGLCWNAEIARLARAHNNANVLSIPARFVSQEEAVQILDTFLSTEFDGGRHQRRIEKIPVA
ncbi:MAG: ribose 5-phosphate isomerase B [Bacteroidales bacterium]|nr:ribose 5-phosphate isomerase B [Bacteroidales bacterium]MBR6176659.1 ribose 5-phosphate isomerase B [Bacteroidales bacterium]